MNAKHLNQAVERESKAIALAVKKPFLHEDKYFGLVNIATDEGAIEEEEYSIRLCHPGPIFNVAELSVSMFLIRTLSVHLDSCWLAPFCPSPTLKSKLKNISQYN